MSTRTWILATAALLMAAPLSAQGPVALVPSVARVALDEADRTPVRMERLYTVRVASFADPGGAVSGRVAAELRSSDIPVWVRRVERRGREVARLEVGAVTSHEDAQALQRAVRSLLSWPTYVARKQGEAVTPRAVRATLALVEGG